MLLLTIKEKLFRTRKLSKEEILPIVLLISSQLIAAINIYFTFIIYSALPVFLGFYSKKTPRTKFFFLWFCFTCAYLLVLFECFVPLLELLPEENLIFVLLLTATTVCFFKTHQKSHLNHLSLSNIENGQPDDESAVNLLSDDESSSSATICQICKKHIPPRAQHCPICKTCVLRHDHHSQFLNCCIGRFNHKFYLLGLGFGFVTLTLFANLCLTSICHPFEVFNIFGIFILLPDDCSDVYGQFDIALCFVASILALFMAVYIFYSFSQQLYLITKGVTVAEWRKGDRERNAHVGCFRNWKNFLFC